MSDNNRNCFVCDELAKLKCERCYELYCSRKCQISDWPEHKKICLEIPRLVSTTSSNRPDENGDSTKSASIDLKIAVPEFAGSPKDNYEADELNDSFESANSDLEELISSDPKDEKNANNQLESLSNYKFIGQSNLAEEESHKAFEKLAVVDNIDTSNGKVNNIPSKIQAVSMETPVPSAKSILETRFRPLSKAKYNSNPLNNVPPSIANFCEQINQKFGSKKIEMSNNKSFVQKPWLTPIPFRAYKELEVTILFIDDKVTNKVWVMETKYKAMASDLLLEIEKYLVLATTFAEEEIRKDALVLAPMDNIYYRAQILHYSQPKKTVKVRLVDYGNDIYVNYSELRTPLDYMKKLHAFAFEIVCDIPVIVGDQIFIKASMIKPFANDNYIIRSKCQEPILSLFNKYGNVKIVGILGKNNAIGMFIDPDFDDTILQLNKILSDKTKYVLNKEPIEGDYVAAAIKEHGYQRGVIVGIQDKTYLIYCVDMGKVFRSNEVKMIPNKLSAMPYRTVVFQIQKFLIKEIDFMNKVCERITFNIKSCARTYNEKSIDCILTHMDKDVAEARALIWSGDVSKLNLELFHISLMPNDFVKITHVIDCAEVCLSISSYSFLLQDGPNSCVQNLEPKIMETVLAVTKDNLAFRAEILDATHDGNWNVKNIDTGSLDVVTRESIYKMNTLIKFLPCYVKSYKLSHINHLKSFYNTTKALELLNRYKSYGTNFIIKFDEKHNDHVNLYFANNKKLSLNEQLVGILLKEDEKNVEEDLNPLVISDIPLNIKYTMKDIEKIPLKIGQTEIIFIMDVSNLKNGFFTGCLPSINWPLKMAKEYTPAIDAYCSRGDIEAEYTPILNEVCFVIDKENHWYRGLCKEKCWNNEFVIMLIDYGYKTRVDKTKLRQMREKFLFPTAANTCYLTDVKDFKKLETTIVPESIIVASVQKDENNLFSIRLQ